MPRRTVLVLVVFAVGCTSSPPAGNPDPASNLLEARVPRAVADDPGWNYQQRADADFDGDGMNETAVLIADVVLDAQGGPLWEDGHRWQVYVEERDGVRTYLYARFLPNGKLTAEVTRPNAGRAPTIVLLEHTPEALGVFEFSYQGPNRLAMVSQLERSFDPARSFRGAPRP
jgi:hypothetical protein